MSATDSIFVRKNGLDTQASVDMDKPVLQTRASEEWAYIRSLRNTITTEMGTESAPDTTLSM